MASRRDTDEAALADRLANYSDALVAVAFLGVSGIGIAIADPDTQCTIADAATYVTVGNLGNGIIFTALILLFRRWEQTLREDAPPSEQVANYNRWIHVGRLVILWTSVIAASVLAFRAIDESCQIEGETASVVMDPSASRELALVSEGVGCSLGS